MTPLITDAQLLALGIAEKALSGITPATRDMHREAASDFVRGKLAPRYSGILATTLAEGDISFETKQAMAVVAAYNLLGHRGFNPSKGSEQQIRDRYDAIMKWLDDIINYRAELVEGATLDRRGPLVGGSTTSNWEGWRSKC